MCRRAKAIFGAAPPIHLLRPLSRGILPLRRPLRRREGGGSPAPVCIYGRVGGRSRRRRSGGGGAAGVWFGVGAGSSGGAAPRGAASLRATRRSSGPGVVPELLWLPSDPCWRRIWRSEPWARRDPRLPPAAAPKATTARWCSWDRGPLAPAVHRHKLRRGAADGHGSVSHRAKVSLTAARRWVVFFVSDAGVVRVLGARCFVFLYVLYLYCVCGFC